MPNEDGDALITPIETSANPNIRGWVTIGQESMRIMAAKIPGPTGMAILNTGAEILARGIRPDSGSGQVTGLVVGYVQSGKTLSFTSVIALAKDNGFPIVIVVAGISVTLLGQSTRRLRVDLQMDADDGHLRWKTFENPTNDETTRRIIEQSLDEWRDPDVPAQEKATVLITVMKNHRHLINLQQLLSQIVLSGVPALIIDDEADQASLNTSVNRNRESPTYRRILDLRDTLPLHTFIQYTATPQAPLLISVIDILSPSFVEVLQPGEDYVGGQTFFIENRNLVEVIPPQDIPSPSNQLIEPPSSLLEALRIFLIGVASGIIQGVGLGNLRRSMLVHPSQQTNPHMEYRVWINEIFDEWQRILELPDTNSDKIDMLAEFQESYDQLLVTVPELPSFDRIIRYLPRAFRRTIIQEMNARGRGRTPTIDWSRAYGWILVGGQSMDRGFTVEGLTVTYMPRGTGVGNADTLQQRARFFGYKRRYLGYCRIYLEQLVITAFEQYVVHEEEMRRTLQDVCDSGTSLTEWKRAFILSPALRPCRRNVVQYNFARGNFSNSWFEVKFVLIPEETLRHNREITQSFLNTLVLQPDQGHPARTPVQIHDMCENVPLGQVLEQLLIPFRLISPEDSENRTGLLLQLARALEDNPEELCTIYRMSPGFQRERGYAVDSGKVKNFFQGEYPVTPINIRGSIYPGDRAIHSPTQITVQIHWLTIREGGMVSGSNVPILTVWVPARIGADWVTQHQPDQNQP